MKNKIVFLFIFSNVLQIYVAQNSKPNSLLVKHIDSLLSTANVYLLSNSDSSVYFANLALTQSKASGNQPQIAESQMMIARSEMLKGNLESALLRLNEALRIYEQNQDKSNIAQCYKLLAILVGKLSKFDEQLQYLQKAYKICKSINDRNGIKSVLLNLSVVYNKKNEFNNSIKVLNECKAYVSDNSQSSFYLYVNYGKTYTKLGKLTLAKLNLDSSIVIARRYKMIDSEVTALTFLGLYYVKLANYKTAIDNFVLAARIAKTNNLPFEELEATNELIKCFEINNDFKNAFSYQKRAKYISDSIFNIEKLNTINVIETKLRVSEKEKTISQQNLTIEKAALEHEVSKRKMTLLIFGLAILCMGLIFVFFVYRRVKKDNALILKQKKEVEHQKDIVDRLNILNQKIFSVISHDFKGPLITLNALIDLLGNKNISKTEFNYYIKDVSQQVVQSNQILENLLSWARTELNLSHHKTLVANPFLVIEDVKKELNFLASKKKIEIINTINKTILLNVPEDILKIIARNLISNALKFSYENNEVLIGYNEDQFFFVQDSGVGVSENDLNHLFTGRGKSNLGTFNETGFGLGLYITFELISKFNGSISVKRNEPRGSIFIFTLPIHETN